MTVTADAPAAAPASESTAPRPAPTGLAGVLGTSDHKAIGRIWLVTALVHLALVGVVALLISIERIDVGRLSIIHQDWAVQADTFRFIAGVFLLAVPLTLAVATAVVPLQVGAPTIAFPRAAAAAAWGYLIGGGLLIASYAMKGGAGGSDKDGVVLFTLAFGMVLVSLAVGWICVATTVLALRTTGMGLRRVPLFAWSCLVAGSVWLLTLPALLGLLVLSYLDVRYDGFLDGSATGLYGRISWVFGTPAVYLLAIPVLGYVASVVPVFLQTRHHLHRVALGLIGLLGALSFGAWTLPEIGGAQNWLYEWPWVVVSVAAIVPLLGLAGLWAATARKGKVVLASPLLFGVVAFLLALLGVAAGALQAIKPITTLADGDAQTRLWGTSWSNGVTALLLLAAVTAAIGGVVYWAPKLLGRRVNEAGARLVALLILVGAGVGGVTTLLAGLFGDPASILQPALDNADTVKALDTVTAIADGVLVLGGVVLILLLLQAALSKGAVADDPWGGHTLEWATTSPPPIGNFASIPPVTSEAPLYDARHAEEAEA
jgi:cytochrome c oxidase subunit 1